MDASARIRSRWRNGLLIAIGLLYLGSVPWYRAADPSPPLLFGLPHWVGVAVGCYFAAAVLNAAAWWLTPLSDGPGESADVSDEADR